MLVGTTFANVFAPIAGIEYLTIDDSIETTKAL